MTTHESDARIPPARRRAKRAADTQAPFVPETHLRTDPSSPLRFDVEFKPSGACVFHCGGISAGTEAALARRLVEEDTPDAPIEGGRPGRLDWTMPSLHRAAVRAVSAKDQGLHPALQAAVVALKNDQNSGAAR